MERVKQLRNEYTEQHIILKEQFEKFQELLKELQNSRRKNQKDAVKL